MGKTRRKDWRKGIVAAECVVCLQRGWVLQPQPPWQGEAAWEDLQRSGWLMPGVLEMSPSMAIPVTSSCPMQLTRLESSACWWCSVHSANHLEKLSSLLVLLCQGTATNEFGKKPLEIWWVWRDFFLLFSPKGDLHLKMQAGLSLIKLLWCW